MSKRRRVPIQIVSEVEAELCDMVVCCRDEPGVARAPLARHFGKCADCGHPIY